MRELFNKRLLLAGFAASLVFFPAAHSPVNGDASKTHLTQPAPSADYGVAIDGLTQKGIFRQSFEAQIENHYLPVEMRPERIDTANLPQKPDRVRPQRFVQRIEHPIHSVKPREKLIIDRSPASETRLTNIQALSGPNYARVIIDLSSATRYIAERAGNNRLVIRMVEAVVSPSLSQNILSLGESGLVKQVVISDRAPARAASVDVVIEGDSISRYSVSQLSDPSRLIVELNGQVESSPADHVAITNQVAITNPDGVSESSEDEKVVSIDPLVAATDRLSAAAEPKTSDRFIKRIMIDAGHGGHDPGVISQNGVSEKEVALDIAQRLRSLLKSRYPDVEVILTRESDYFMTLKQRAAMANCWRADLFISIHANASESPAASGVETYYLNPNRVSAKPLQITSPQRAGLFLSNQAGESEELARHIQRALVKGIGSASPPTARNRGVKHAAFGVLLRAKMPSVLAEVSFLSNPRDAVLLRSTQFRESIATSLLSGLDAYLKNN